METALITGGCGFVGRHFTAELVKQGYKVTVVDDLSTGLHPDKWPRFLKTYKNFTFINQDVRSYFCANEQSFDLILHLAAVVGGRMTIEGDPLKVATDLAIDAMFFNWLPKLNPMPQVVLNFSSSAAYPINFQTQQKQIILTEDMIDFKKDIGVPDMTYGWAKLTAEFLASYCVEKYGMKVLNYRPFSGYGEDQDQSYPFPRICKRVFDREDPMVIWGSGQQARDFVHIDDIVKFVLKSINYMEAGESINISSGIGTSFFELAQQIQAVAGVELELRNDPSKPEGVFYRVGDNKKQLKFYQLEVSLEEGIQRTLEHFTTELNYHVRPQTTQRVVGK
ncbi:NAD-dependent epimerase/dehydratase family protein [Aliiglaciecola lipolytica]|uniref:NAD-dependent epimerase/dehydratase n=1 Tax=Aliiglaciecola lipolytica E3 TaxID=1127673 RepID=K6Y658_9ALTE|nr:NAD-dependent epimerase/dehydratase family protein [Aliiglaciecola lipolytica]GAC13712.1 NAD-dependent epimerase/dehydratase [Aliiglaciecola lipolytica E3]